jgi:hypothetical protein
LSRHSGTRHYNDEILGGEPVGGDIGDGTTGGRFQFLRLSRHFGEHGFQLRHSLFASI